MSENKIAQLLIVKPSNSLSSQLVKITGDSWNLCDYKGFHDSEVIQHIKTGKWFIVMSQTQYDNFNPEALKDLFGYYKFFYGFTEIIQ
jgi:hypothetical protein